MTTVLAFDIGGTLLNDHGAVYRALGRAVGRPIVAQRGMSKRDVIRTLVPPERWEKAEARFVSELRAAFAKEPPALIHPNLRAQLAAFRPRYAIGITTGFDRHIAAEVLDAANIEVDYVVNADCVTRGKPAPDMLLALAARANAANIVAVGDTVADMEAGVAANATTIGVLSGGTSKAELVAAGASKVITHVGELGDHL